MAKAKKTTRTKTVKKRWIPILAPKMFNSQVIGETHVVEPQSAIGKTVSVSLSNLIGDMKRQNIQIMFKIVSTTGEKASAEVIGYKISPSSIKRMVRRDKKKVDQSIVVETADGTHVRLKVIMVTRNATNASVLTSLRMTSEENLRKTVKKMKYGELVIDIVHHKLQAILKKQLSKVYPLQICEVRHMEIEKVKKHNAEEPKKEEAVKEEKKVEEKAEEKKPEVKEEAPKVEKEEEEEEKPKEEAPKEEKK